MKTDTINLRIQHALKNQLKAEAKEKHLTLTELLLGQNSKQNKNG